MTNTVTLVYILTKFILLKCHKGLLTFSFTLKKNKKEQYSNSLLLRAPLLLWKNGLITGWPLLWGGKFSSISYFSASEIWPDKSDSHWCEWLYKRGSTVQKCFYFSFFTQGNTLLQHVLSCLFPIKLFTLILRNY